MGHALYAIMNKWVDTGLREMLEQLLHDSVPEVGVAALMVLHETVPDCVALPPTQSSERERWLAVIPHVGDAQKRFLFQYLACNPPTTDDETLTILVSASPPLVAFRCRSTDRLAPDDDGVECA